MKDPFHEASKKFSRDRERIEKRLLKHKSKIETLMPKQKTIKAWAIVHRMKVFEHVIMFDMENNWMVFRDDQKSLAQKRLSEFGERFKIVPIAITLSQGKKQK